MRIGVPREIKPQEARVGLTPAGARELAAHGHEVLVERAAGQGAGFADADYERVGARIADSADEVFTTAGMVIKVKEPQPEECARLREDQILFAYLHLAPDARQTQALVDSGCVAIAYETVTDEQGALPLLSPMSEIAGRLSVQAGAACLENINGGSGLLMSGVPGVPGARTVVIGGGVVGSNALRMAIGVGARVTVLDKSLGRLRSLDALYAGRLNTVYSNVDNLERAVAEADLVIGAVLVPGSAAPRLVTREMIGRMRAGSVVVDVAIDQGGCFETSRATSHSDPIYVTDGVVHYCVSNMPGCVARTSTFALTHATLPFVIRLADNGYRRALLDDPNLRQGLNVCHGKVTHRAVADSLGYAYCSSDRMLGGG